MISDETNLVRLHIPDTRGHEYGGDFKVAKTELIGALLRFNLRYAGNAQVKRLNLASVSLTPEILIPALREYNGKKHNS